MRGTSLRQEATGLSCSAVCLQMLGLLSGFFIIFIITEHYSPSRKETEVKKRNSQHLDTSQSMGERCEVS